MTFGTQRVPVPFAHVFKYGALRSASGVTKLSISRFRILAVSEMIDVEVLIHAYFHLRLHLKKAQPDRLCESMASIVFQFQLRLQIQAWSVLQA